MDVQQVTAVLYASVPVVSIAGWVPQVWRLARDPARGWGLSVVTWSMWLFSGLVALLYAAVNIGDVLLIVTAAVNAAGQVCVWGFAVAARVRRREGSARRGSSAPPE